MNESLVSVGSGMRIFFILVCPIHFPRYRHTSSAYKKDIVFVVILALLRIQPVSYGKS